MARPRKNPVPDPALLAAALEGLELQKQRIDEQIQQVKRLLTGNKPPRAAAAAPDAPVAKRKRRALSAAARKRIAAAQRRRWAEYHQASGTPKRATRKSARAEKAEKAEAKAE